MKVSPARTGQQSAYDMGGVLWRDENIKIEPFLYYENENAKIVLNPKFSFFGAKSVLIGNP